MTDDKYSAVMRMPEGRRLVRSPIDAVGYVTVGEAVWSYVRSESYVAAFRRLSRSLIGGNPAEDDHQNDAIVAQCVGTECTPLIRITGANLRASCLAMADVAAKRGLDDMPVQFGEGTYNFIGATTAFAFGAIDDTERVCIGFGDRILRIDTPRVRIALIEWAGMPPMASLLDKAQIDALVGAMGDA